MEIKLHLLHNMVFFLFVGLCNAPATFSRAVSLVLREISWKSVIAFLDDVVILRRDFDSHLRNLSEVLRRFDQYGMKLKPKKNVKFFKVIWCFWDDR